MSEFDRNSIVEKALYSNSMTDKTYRRFGCKIAQKTGIEHKVEAKVKLQKTVKLIATKNLTQLKNVFFF